MATAIHTPRVNNNDDEVKLIALSVRLGDTVKAGQIVAQVETDKSVVDVEAGAAGYVIGIQGEVETMLQVGSVLLWLGSSVDEAPPRAEVAAAAGDATKISAKARLLLRRYGLDPASVMRSGEALRVEDVERHVALLGLAPKSVVSHHAAATKAETLPEVEGRRVALRPEERGMAATVTWHRDHAVAGYIELEFDAARWDQAAAEFAAAHKLLFSPLLSLLAWRLVTAAVDRPLINATLVGDERHEYASVNLGFTVQSGETLYLAVVRDAQALDAAGFVAQLGELQRKAASNRLSASEITGATLGFTSMARWKVSRHIPILPPHTAIMIAHSVDPSGRGILGASYDHRVLTGGEVARVLQKIATPPSAF